jgi:putative tricarboxylic transport membrane protein
MMDALNGLLTGFGVILTPANLYLCFLGSLIGTLVGVQSARLQHLRCCFP